VAEHPGAAGGRLDQRRQDPHERRLAGAVGAEQPDDGSGLNGEVETGEGLHRPEGLLDLLYLHR
jgi:hypothetical protein